ncbi:MAG: NAD(+) kinase [Magnetococcales bacterium]|nr:NAD(+)/NADH kinase [Magnetococcales bacterium]NGZ04804.1 NAD(+) kinase [Magnetococcales bacterium]
MHSNMEWQAMDMRQIGIITKRSDPRALEATRQLAEWLVERGRAVTVVSEIATAASIPLRCAARQSQERLPEGQDLVVVVGGDGTFIAAARAVEEVDVPLLGVNMGRLGFLTDTARDGMFDAMEQVLAGEYRIEERMRLSVEVVRQGKLPLACRVLNDVVVHKGELARMMEFDVSMDDQFVFSSRADGLIVSTPTGSTAYALSAGGPIIHPALNAILLVPICPHTLTNRPIVVPGTGTARITLAANGLDRLLTLDGQAGFPLSDGDEIRVRRSTHPLRVLHAPDRNHYTILREKLRWGE